jgi:hypothetical protein
MEVIRIRTTIRDQNIFTLNQTSLGPFDDTDDNIKLFINNILLLRLNYTVYTYKPYLYEDNLECIKWEILQKYVFVERSHFKVSLDIFNNPCGAAATDLKTISRLSEFINRLQWVHLLIFILAFISLYQGIKDINKFGKIYMRAKHRKRKESNLSTSLSSGIKSEDSIYYNPLLDTSYEDELNNNSDNKNKRNNRNNDDDDDIVVMEEPKGKRKVSQFYNNNKNNHKGNEHKIEKTRSKYRKFQFWAVICVFANIFQLFGAGISLSSPINVTLTETLLIGLGCFFAWINIVKYIEYHRDWSLLYDVLYKTSPAASRYIIGVFPVFIAFIFFGVCVFWQSERFANTSSSMFTLFAIMQGDSVFDTFQDLKGIHFFMGQIYCLAFCTIFIL